MAGLSLDHAIIALVALIGFALIALGGRWSAARYFLRGLASVGAGALLLVALTARIYPAVINPVARNEQTDLRQQLAKAQSERDRAVDELQRAVADRKQADLKAAETLTRIGNEVHETTMRFARPDSPVRLGEPTSRPPQSADAVVRDLRALRTAEIVTRPADVVSIQPPAIVPQPPVATAAVAAPPAVAVSPAMAAPPAAAPSTAPTALPPEVKIEPAQKQPPVTAAINQAAPRQVLSTLRTKLASRLETKAFRIEPLAQPELIAGQPGSYYSIDLRNLETGKEFLFDSGRYTFTGGTIEYRQALGVFLNEIVAPLEGKHAYQLYVRGAADRLSYVGRQEAGYEVREIDLLRSDTSGRYTSAPQTIAVGDVIRNRDLPNLRAAYLRSIIGEASPRHVPDILEGLVLSNREAQSRNAEIILFIEW
ncbi:MAG: hypothetical protein RL291_525 [Pseudomonadota bacterium]